MEFQAYPTSQPRLFAKDITMSTFDDIPSFEEAFNSDSLRKFYQQQETGLSSCCESPDHEDSAFEEVETQASPLLRYLNKFNQDTPLPVLQSAINLNQIFDSAEMSGETFPESFLQKDSYEMTHLKIFEDSSKQQMEKAEGKKVIEMKGKLSMTMCNGNFTFKGMANPQVVQSANIKGQDETSNFERLLQNKKIFKIQKDVKPKCSTKLKVQAKNKASNNIVKLPFTITQSPSKEVTSISGFLNMK